MSDLHLTADQLAELPEMGIAGKMAADELLLWRKIYCWGPWEITDDIEDIAEALVTCRGYHSHYGEAPSMEWRDDDEARAIIHARSTAEIRAAKDYWTWKLVTTYNAALTASLEGSDGMCQMMRDRLKEIGSTLNDIAEAYVEIKQ